MDWELEQMKQLSDELEIPLEQVMLVKATLEWSGIDYDLEYALKGLFDCTSVG